MSVAMRIEPDPPAAPHLTLNKRQIERMVAGNLRSTIDAHGPIDRCMIGSAAKRITGQLWAHLQPEGAPEGGELDVAATRNGE